MSFTCGRHGWRHAQSECPMCTPDALANTQTIVREQSNAIYENVEISNTGNITKRRGYTTMRIEAKKCECGSAAVGGLNHSSWCPMFKESK